MAQDMAQARRKQDKQDKTAQWRKAWRKPSKQGRKLGRKGAN